MLKDSPEAISETPIDTKESTLLEVKEVVKKARSFSAPGPNGISISYKVCKMCPLLLKRLWQLEEGKGPRRVVESRRHFHSQREGLKRISQFRSISMLNVEGKIFFAVLSSH